ncbi:glycosyltransferase [Arthrobacter sp. Soil782]|uniref:glycosyltransferase family 4 protein n=1 Tax=Arthrobacter sp. Soil782 TaxID=1736410 RepID=UPI0006F7CEBA|nr:glycosyltransferase family 4 protein [Arthrobacter sp. Soil782]KRF04277.1 glycosyltransferase [Arthrobacter sp. Soil782]
MKILLASRIFAPESGAAAYRLAALVTGLQAAGHDVTVFTTRAPGAARSQPGISRWPVLRDRGGAVRGYMQYASFDLPLFFRLLFASEYDVLVVEPPPTTGVVARLASALRRKPYIYFSADVSSTAAEGIGVSPIIVRILKTIERSVLRGAAGVLSVSPGVTAAVHAIAGDDVPVVEVGTGVDTRIFTPTGLRRDEGRTLVYAGTMSEIQGAGIFVDAFLKIYQKHPGARLLMYGQGVELENLRHRSVPAGDQIRFPGSVPGPEVAIALRSSAAGLASVRPSRGYDFAFATKALAALACGTPVIYSGVGPLADLIRPNNLGWTVAWDADQVADAMDLALTAPVSEADRDRISTWTSASYSLTAVGGRAAQAVTDFVR